MAEDRSKLIEQLIHHEGLRLKPYRDSVGKLTIGVGRNLDDVGISNQEAMFLLGVDVARCEKQLNQLYPWFQNLDPVRQGVLINMCFNMGIYTLSKFVTTLDCIRLGYYETAAARMLKSAWASQVGDRAKELAEQIRTGQYQA